MSKLQQRVNSCGNCEDSIPGRGECVDDVERRTCSPETPFDQHSPSSSWALYVGRSLIAVTSRQVLIAAQRRQGQPLMSR